MAFKIDGDAASMLTRGNTATVPVVNGKAQVQIVGRHSGKSTCASG
jgi:hypothetical protein